MIATLAVAGYRSLRDVRITLGRLTVVTGVNGSGKSSLFHALKLLSDVAQGRIVASLAAEGGLSSTLWAGPENFSREMRQRSQPVQGTVRVDPVTLRLGFSSEDVNYAIDLGLPSNQRTRFNRDPHIKAETVWTGAAPRQANLIAERRGPLVRLRDSDDGAWRSSYTELSPFDSMISHCADAGDGFELLQLRERMRAWRFYDDLRTDRDAPARRRQVGTFTPVLAGNGQDVGAALQTIIEVGDARSLSESVADAFDGATLSISEQFEVEMQQYGLLRPLAAAELSDGTLRYLLLAAALLSPRPPELMILNEPEASLHPNLLAALGRLICKAAERCQVIVISHSVALVAALTQADGSALVELHKDLGETVAREREPAKWAWPPR